MNDKDGITLLGRFATYSTALFYSEPPR